MVIEVSIETDQESRDKQMVTTEEEVPEIEVEVLTSEEVEEVMIEVEALIEAEEEAGIDKNNLFSLFFFYFFVFVTGNSVFFYMER